MDMIFPYKFEAAVITTKVHIWYFFDWNENIHNMVGLEKYQNYYIITLTKNKRMYNKAEMKLSLKKSYVYHFLDTRE